MAVFIDEMDCQYGRMKMSHMIADSTRELMEMIRSLGINPKWIQYPGTPKEHLDISMSKKKQALKLGAVQVTSRKIVMKIREKREALAKASVLP